MSSNAKQQRLVDTIMLVSERVLACPECADKGRQLLELATELNACFVDRVAVHDAIEAQTIEDVSEARVELTIEAVLSSIRRAG